MARIRIRIRKGKVVELADLPEEVKGWLEPAESFEVLPEDLWAGYDPEKIRAALREGPGILTEPEADELVAKIYRWREEGSRPAE